MFTRTTAPATWRRTIFTLTATSAAVTALALPASATTTHDREEGAYTITIDRTNAYPESIAADSSYIYTGSIGDGTVPGTDAPTLVNDEAVVPNGDVYITRSSPSPPAKSTSSTHLP